MPTSSPSSYTIDAGPDGNSQDCTFSIPAGTYSAASWSITGTVSNNSISTIERYASTSGGAHDKLVGSHTGNGSFTDSLIAVTSDQLADINAAAGGTLTVNNRIQIASGGLVNHQTDAVSSFVLTLTTPSGPVYVTSDPFVVEATFPAGAKVGPPPQVTSLPLMVGVYFNLSAPTLPVGVTSVPIKVKTLFQDGSLSVAGGGVSVSSVPLQVRAVVAGGQTTLDSATTDPSGPVSVGAGNLRMRFCRDNKGEKWTDEVSVASGVDADSCGGAFTGNRWLAMYSKLNGAEVYVKTTENPDDWSGSTETLVGGATGKVYGMARNDAGVLCAVLSAKKAWVSRDMGETWESHTIPAVGYPIAIHHLFVICVPAGDKAVHYISQDAGVTWK